MSHAHFICVISVPRAYYIIPVFRSTSVLCIQIGIFVSHFTVIFLITRDFRHSSCFPHLVYLVLWSRTTMGDCLRYAAVECKTLVQFGVQHGVVLTFFTAVVRSDGCIVCHVNYSSDPSSPLI